jgi:hypothetical protein
MCFERFKASHNFQTDIGTHLVSTQVRHWGLKRSGCESDHPASSSDEVKNARSYTSSSPYPSVVCCVVK